MWCVRGPHPGASQLFHDGSPSHVACCESKAVVTTESKTRRGLTSDTGGANGSNQQYGYCHGGVRRSSPGKCPKCDIVLVQENIHFAQSRHMAGSLSPLAIVGALMTLAVAVMMFMRCRVLLVRWPCEANAVRSRDGHSGYSSAHVTCPLPRKTDPDR